MFELTSILWDEPMGDPPASLFPISEPIGPANQHTTHHENTNAAVALRRSPVKLMDPTSPK